MGARAIVVADHAAFRASARRLLELTGYDVVAEAGDGASGLALVRDLEPELVLLDVALPDMSGFDVADALPGGPSPGIPVPSRDPPHLRPPAPATGAARLIPEDPP